MLGVKLSLLVLVHPIDTFLLVKRDRKQFPAWYASLLFLIAVLSQFFFIYFVHYPLSTLRPKDANLALELVKLILPLITWVFASYAITTIMEGESHFSEVFIATSLCTVPYSVITVLLTILSRFMSQEEDIFFVAIQALSLIWMILLILISLKTLNDYTFGKLIGVLLLSLFSMLVIWALALLFFALTSQLVVFFQDLSLEIKMLINQ